MHIFPQCHQKFLHCTNTVISALLDAFKIIQSMSVFQRCVGIRLHAWFSAEWAAFVMLVGVSVAMGKIGNLNLNTKWVLHKKLHSYVDLEKLYWIVTLAQLPISKWYHYELIVFVVTYNHLQLCRNFRFSSGFGSQKSSIYFT